MIGRTDNETTLYLGHTDIVLPKGSTTPNATRYIDLGNGQQAVRNDDSGVSFTIGDHHGTGQLAVDATTLDLTQRRTTPFGRARGAEPENWPSTKGFVGGTTDTSTGLTHLGAREYDPATGRFISVDPIMDLADPQQIHGYTYANNAPATLSDPTGLRPDGICGGNSSTCVPSNSVSKTTVTYNESWTKKKTGWYWKKYDVNQKGKRYYTHGCLGCKNWIDRTRVIPWTEGVEALGIFIPVLGPAADIVLGANAAIRGDWQEASARAASVIPLVGEARLAKNLLKKTKCEDNSFVPGTKVLMADGSTKQIEEVRNGDKVLATDPKTGKTDVETVTAEIKGEGSKRLVEVTLDIDGDQGSATETVTATHNHPFWVPEIGEWIDATDLKTGQWLKTSAGTYIQVTAIERWTAQRAVVHNLTVSDLHTYYVLAGATPVLVHNCGGTATVSYDPDMGPTGHAIIRIDMADGRSQITEQVINGIPARPGQYNGLPTTGAHAFPEDLGPNTRSLTFDLPNAETAHAAQRRTIDADLGAYDGMDNSCVTYCVDILRAGGVNLPEGRRGMAVLRGRMNRG
ncbi:polymorphic toxin-type HINT domain-containing protein [Streptomyces sp. NPDC058637]|uniref:polymorphic toxin-type HINT domain-containing protein n=1 Tax=Streptomyces sp. NPDC058637 TaxID=3346569 RepID=UPI00364DEE83